MSVSPTHRRRECRGNGCPSESARALLSGADKSAFALLLTRVTEPKLLFKEDYEKNDQRDGGQRLSQSQQSKIQGCERGWREVAFEH